MFTGVGTALVTPFKQDGSLDEACLRRLVQRQIQGGVDFLVPCGTTGESPTLTREEHLRVVAVTIEEARGKPVVAGAGGYNTAEVIELAKDVEALGANGILSVTPYYNKPTQEGLYQHFKAIASAVRVPLVVYNVPGRTGVNVEPATLLRLQELNNIVAVKEASANLAQITRIASEARNGFVVLSGDDILTQSISGVGGQGVISVLSNVVPDRTSAALKSDDAFRALIPLMDALFIESNPIPVKAAMAMMGLLQPVWRLPLVAPQPATEAKLRQVLGKLGLIT